MTQLTSRTPTENTPTATAWDGPRLVGLARALDDGELVAYLHYVLVDPAYQGQGIASGLIAQMKERFRNYLYLEVMPQGEQERPPLNERQGFTLMQDGVAMQICNFSDKRLASVAIEPHCLTLTATMRLAR